MTEASPGPVQRLHELHRAYLAGFGDASASPLIALMAATLAAGPDEALAAAVVARVESEHAKTNEALALTVVGRELDADRRPPTLWLVADIAAVKPTPEQSLDQALRHDGAVRVAHRFMQESERTLGGEALAARILFPAQSAATGHVDAAARLLRDVWRQWVTPANDARAALLRAAIEKKG